MRIIKTWRNSYGEGFSTCRPRNITLIEGLTVLVGCNGAGKTTLLRNVKEQLQKEKIPYYYYDNLHDGGSKSMSLAFETGNMALGATMFMSSEGETISMNMSQIATNLMSFFDTGKSPDDLRMEKWKEFFRDEDEIDTKIVSNERWLLLDAVDSGYSIDNIVDLKDFFDLLKDEAKKKGLDLYIIAVANEYELACGENCFDVNAGKYITFKDYDDYKKFILKSRQKKDKRYKSEVK